jgi:hypothetical protein
MGNQSHKVSDAATALATHIDECKRACDAKFDELTQFVTDQPNPDLIKVSHLEVAIHRLDDELVRADKEAKELKQKLKRARQDGRVITSSALLAAAIISIEIYIVHHELQRKSMRRQSML